MSTKAQRIEAKLVYLECVERARETEECISCGKRYHVSVLRYKKGWYYCPACRKK